MPSLSLNLRQRYLQFACDWRKSAKLVHLYMTRLDLLKACQDRHDVAVLLGIKPAHLSYLLYKKPATQKYAQFQIPKKGGGARSICAPIGDLKHVQSLLADLLSDCAEQLRKAYGRKSAHGFVKGRTTMSNAHEHRGRAFVFNLDLQDFFGTINFGRVRGFFMADKDFSLKPEVATVLAQIACFNNSLPQGSPASPVISNLVGNVLDTYLARMARENGCTYTRYADDLTFSTNRADFPPGLARIVGSSWEVGPSLLKVITRSGFSVNSAKVRMQYQDSRQSVTGLVVNRKANTSASYRATLRAMTNRLYRTGAFQHEWRAKDAAGNLVQHSDPGTIDQLQGMLAHVEHVDQFNRRLRQDQPVAAPGRHGFYKRFFLFSQFFAAPLPVVLCEGKTDNVYMVGALHSRAASFPMLAKITPPKVDLLIRIYKYVNRKPGQILGLSGGQGELGKFIPFYLDQVSKYFKATSASQQPVILLVDNDQGGKGPYNSAGAYMKKKFDMSQPFERVAANLYLVPTPLPPGATESCIEDCFTPATLATVLGGKTFNYKAPKIDETKEYSKAYFAEHVVRPNMSSIDFSGFDPLLARIEQVILHYATVPK